jgi:D-arginine dehydrogenase
MPRVTARTADFLVIGGGIAGMSAAARLAGHGRVIVLEAEDAIGFHSSGRSAAFYHFGLGNPLVRGLTAWSRPFFEAPPDGFSDVPLSRPVPALFIATEAMLDDLETLHDAMAAFTATVERTDVAAMQALCPVLRVDGENPVVAGVVDHGGRGLDADALLQGFARIVRHSGEIRTGQRIARISREDADWRVTSEKGEAYTAPVVINAAGAWADEIAIMAGVRPIGLSPKRRTIIVFDPPVDTDVRAWPFVKTATDAFYMVPQGNRLMASPTDEVPSPPCDAQPEDYDLALAAWQVEQFTTLAVPRLAGKWAGLRSFAPDRMPVAGFAPDAPGFFWLAGQGGFGLQTSPAMAAIAEALVTGGAWPQGLEGLGVTAAGVGPGRQFVV